MTNNKEQSLRLRWISLRLVERFGNVLYPIDIAVLLRELPKIGYIVPRKVLKGILEPGESLAVKGNLELLINQDNKTLGLQGDKTLEVIDGFSELRSFWLERLNPSPCADTHYIELGGEGMTTSLKNPIEVFAKFWAQCEAIRQLSKTLGFDVVNFGLHLVPPNVDPNRTEWFDLRIDPKVISSSNQYYVNIIWRDSNLETALKHFKEVDDIVATLIKRVEKE
ncbi:MAG: hypothetical protein HY669_04205 [Chloroflexi bacterium]|nr:hypothetical protein [Chloroflexota bacterium]